MLQRKISTIHESDMNITKEMTMAERTVFNQFVKKHKQDMKKTEKPMPTFGKIKEKNLSNCNGVRGIMLKRQKILDEKHIQSTVKPQAMQP